MNEFVTPPKAHKLMQRQIAARSRDGLTVGAILEEEEEEETQSLSHVLLFLTVSVSLSLLSLSVLSPSICLSLPLCICLCLSVSPSLSSLYLQEKIKHLEVLRVERELRIRLSCAAIHTPEQRMPFRITLRERKRESLQSLYGHLSGLCIDLVFVLCLFVYTLTVERRSVPSRMSAFICSRFSS